MSESQPENDPESQSVNQISSISLTQHPPNLNMDISGRLESDDSEFIMADTGTPKTDISTPKSKIVKKRDDSVKSAPPKSKSSRGSLSKQSTGRNSSIPLLRKASPTSTRNPTNKSSKTSTICYRTSVIGNKHTLEVQFLNKRKRLTLLTKDMIDKQKPVLDLYENLVQIKQKLNDLGKTVQLEDIKLVSIDKERSKEKEKDKEKDAKPETGGGESISEEIVVGMKTSIEEIPRTLLGICQNLLSRRAVIVELLESVTKSEVTVDDISDKIEALKSEGSELQKSLDLIINEHETKINDLVSNWQTLLMDKKFNKNETEMEDLQEQVEKQRNLTDESNQVIQDLHKKLEEEKVMHDRSVNELDIVIRGLKEQIKKLETDVDTEKKATIDHKTRNSVNGQTIRLLKTKISELESKSKEFEDKNSDLSKKLKSLQDSHKSKECQWVKEKEDLSKTIKQQETVLQKITSDRNQFETRYKHAEKKTGQTEEKMIQQIETLKKNLEETSQKLQEVSSEKEQIEQRCASIEGHLVRMGMDSKREMNEINNSFDWGKSTPKFGMEEYRDEIATKVLVAQMQDRIKELEQEKTENVQMAVLNQEVASGADMDNIRKNHDVITKYQQLLEESEEKLREKSMEVAKLTSEIRHLKVRQDVLEEQNVVCPTIELQNMVEEGRSKLNELMKKSMESEQKIADYESIIEKQSKQMNEMENLLRYRDNMTGVLKTSRDELIMEKESLTKYSQELRSVLIEVTKEGKIKDRLIKELQDKVEEKERVINKLEKNVRDLESNLMATNEKRFKLQETIGTMEKELQTTKAHVNQLADIQTRYDAGMKYSKPLLDSNPVSVKNSAPSSQTALNAKSLLNVSLKKMDFLRARLFHLSTIDIDMHGPPIQFEPNYTKSTQTFANKKSSQNFEKVLALTSRRCQMLQTKFNSTYDYFSDLVNIKETPVHTDYDSDYSSMNFCNQCKSHYNIDDLSTIINLDQLPVLRASVVTSEDLLSLNTSVSHST